MREHYADLHCSVCVRDHVHIIFVPCCVRTAETGGAFEIVAGMGEKGSTTHVAVYCQSAESVLLHSAHKRTVM